MSLKTDCVVVGAGASGMMCVGSISDISEGIKIVLLEKNSIYGKKLLITGKGRCNVTNNCDKETLLKNVVSNNRFLFSAFTCFSSQDTMAFFENLGVPLKTERGNRVFPVSDRSSDIVNALKKYADKPNIIKIKGELSEICVENNKIKSCILSDGRQIFCSSVVIATGGKSYPFTGSTGKGYQIAERLGHTITPVKPSLVPLFCKQSSVCKELLGLSLRNVRLTLKRNGKKVFEDFGELVFTENGISGPLILSASPHSKIEDEIYIDLKPALDEKTLDTRLISDFSDKSNKNFSNSLDDLLPRKLIPVIIHLSKIPPEKKVNSITKEERRVLLRLLKEFSFTVNGFGSFDEAVVTSGGVSTKEIDPKTMMSKIIDGLYFAGEIIDVDAYTGGFNLQIAFSTGKLAGISVADSYINSK